MSPIAYPPTQLLVHRSARNNPINSSTVNLRTNVVASRSSTSTSVHRSTNNIGSAPRSQNHPNNSPTKANDEKTKQNTQKQSAKSVFPLFFDIL